MDAITSLRLAERIRRSFDVKVDESNVGVRCEEPRNTGLKRCSRRAARTESKGISRPRQRSRERIHLRPSACRSPRRPGRKCQSTNWLATSYGPGNACCIGRRGHSQAGQISLWTNRAVMLDLTEEVRSATMLTLFLVTTENGLGHGPFLYPLPLQEDASTSVKCIYGLPARSPAGR